MAQPPADVLVLSPHLDDAVFSLGALIARRAAEGARVLVVTLYTDGPPPAAVPAALRAFADFPRRRAEDAAAHALLGSTYEHLGLVERAFRSPALPGPAHVFRTPRPPAPLSGLTDAEEAVGRALEAYPRAAVYAPLGVGNHHDHVVLFAAAARAALARDALDRVGFYEDAYAFSRLARAAHFVTRARPSPLRPTATLASLRALTMSLALWGVRRGPAPEAFLPPLLARAHWRFAPEPRAGFGGAKAGAVASYASQLAVLGGAAFWARVLERQARAAGDAEAVWRLA
jgi:LmbE family N-acetylglucosaminyl deacetylase